MMIKCSRLAGIIVMFAIAILLADCKHDPPMGQGGGSVPDSLYVGHLYSFTNASVPNASYRKVKDPVGYTQTYEGVQLGRMLFYDSTLSLNKRVSCGSCHKQEHAFSDPERLSQNVHGSTTRNASALMNLGISNIFFWDGRQATIEDAVDDALTHEQSPDINSTIRYLDTTTAYRYLFKKAFGRPQDSTQLVTQLKMVQALSQFIRTLRSENSKYDAYKRGEAGASLTAQEISGETIFFDGKKGDCAHCHVDAPFLTFANMFPPMRNNALDTIADAHNFVDIGYGRVTNDINDYGKFKIPTLRNVEVSAPYMHDGRFTTLEQIADHYGTRDSLRRSPTIDPLMERFIDPSIPDLTSQQKADLIVFLKTLTDTSFLHNPAFSNPFH